jgi:hypothetical protein
MFKDGKITQESLDNIVLNVNNIFKSSARKVGSLHYTDKMYKTGRIQLGCNIPSRRTCKKPWFNDKCKTSRKLFFQSKDNYTKGKTNENFALMKETSKCYKKDLAAAKLKYQNQICSELRALKNCKPKQYWNLLNAHTVHKVKEPLLVPYEEMYNHFKQLSSQESTNSHENQISPSDYDNEHSQDFLNVPFSNSEIADTIRNLKNNKACGTDQIINEYFKATSHFTVPLLTELFNIILNTGTVPSEWGKGIIKPIFKNKGTRDKPEFYRGITILSCFGKLFTSLINRRLTKYLDFNGTIGQEQAGFRNDYSTVDHIFVLKTIIELYMYKRKKLYCLFVDYSTAFDKINRTILWKKLIHNGVNGKILHVVHNIYKNTKSCIDYNGLLSTFF